MFGIEKVGKNVICKNVRIFDLQKSDRKSHLQKCGRKSDLQKIARECDLQKRGRECHLQKCILQKCGLPFLHRKSPVI